MLEPTEKLKQSGYTLDQLRAAQWTDAQIVEQGYAVIRVENAAPQQTAEPTVFVTASDGKKHPVQFPAPVPNVLGVTRLETVAHLWNEVSPISNYPGGYSHMQQVLLVANELAKRKGLK